MVPGLRRMAALTDFNTTSRREASRSARVGPLRDIELSIYRIGKGEEVVAAIDTAKASGASAINILASGVLWANRHLIMDRVAVHTCRPCIQILKWRMKVDLLPTDHASRSFSAYPGSTASQAFPRNQTR